MIAENLKRIKKLLPYKTTLVAVSKFKSIEEIQEAYDAGHRDFGENRVQEMVDKYEKLPKDIRWHFIGHLQSNKVKYLVDKAYMIHSVDSEKLLNEINKACGKHKIKTKILLQVHIAQEESKYGLDEAELEHLLNDIELGKCPHVKVQGLMGMATFSEKLDLVRSEFVYLKGLYDYAKENYPSLRLNTLSMGMSGDYNIAVEVGSNMVRIGSAIFGERSSNT